MGKGTGPDLGPGASPSERERDRCGPGLYVHFPFCVRRCGYCDFFVVLGGDDVRESFVEMLLREIDLSASGADGGESARGAALSAPEVGRTPSRSTNRAGAEEAEDRKATRPTVEVPAREAAVGAPPVPAGALPGFGRTAFRTLFFGGGTPSLLLPEQLARILDRLRSRFAFAEDVEITMECNPESATLERLTAYRGLGVNRISFGVQSLDGDELQLLDRAHAADDAKRRLDEARRAGFRSISLDLIYGLPGSGQSQDDRLRWLRTLETALALGPDHLSAYLLALEPHVPLARRLRRGELAALPGDEECALQYEVLRTRAEANGLAQYEISNFARAGQESRHNQNYWLTGDYLGLGPSAHSHRNGVRWSNVRSLPGYREALLRGQRPLEGAERLDTQQRAEEWIFLGLRRREGISLPILTEWWGEGAWDRLRAASSLSSWLSFDQPLASGESRVRLTPEAYFVSNTVFAEVAHVLGPVRGRGGRLAPQ